MMRRPETHVFLAVLCNEQSDGAAEFPFADDLLKIAEDFTSGKSR